MWGAQLLPLLPQEMSVGYANGIRVMSMTHTGEPGFMLYIPIEVSLTAEGGCSPTPAGRWQGREPGLAGPRESR